MPNRKNSEKTILQFVNEIEPTGYNAQAYAKIFSAMSDKQFDSYMKDLRDGTKTLVLFKPLYKAQGITIENNLKVAEKHGLKIFERLRFTGNPNEPDHLTPIEYMVIDLPWRKQSQTWAKKTSVPDNNKTIDQLTYQPTGASKGSKVSFPELQVMIGMGLDSSIKELTQMRGGDRGGFAAYNAMFMRYGNANLKTLDQFTTGVESTKTLKTYLACMHITSTL
jgi:hypothetical protein